MGSQRYSVHSVSLGVLIEKFPSVLKLLDWAEQNNKREDLFGIMVKTNKCGYFAKRSSSALIRSSLGAIIPALQKCGLW
jgi:hypothetical protein